MKKLILLFLFVTGLASLSNGQVTAPKPTYSVAGTVIDSLTRKPAEFTTASLKGPTGQVVKAMLTKADGTFAFNKIPEGKYSLSFVFVGYAAKTVSINLSGEQKEMNAGTILLSPSNKQLKTVSVVGERSLIKQEPDRLIYDLTADPESKSFSVMEMMRKVPLLSVDADDNIMLKGNTSYKIFINGRPSSMMERNPKDILRSMPAASIQRIEVITTPPSKYDAEGIAGIINIITNKKVDNGYNGTVNVNTRFPVGGPGTGESFNFKNGKLGIAAFGGGNLSHTPATTMTSSRITSSTNLNQHTDRSSDNTNGYLGTELSYEADSLNLISAQFNINGSRNTGNSSQVSLLNATLPQVYQLDNSSVGTGSGLDAALNYQLGFKKDKNRLLTFSYKYFTFNNDQDNELIVSNSSGYFDPNYKQNNNSLYREHTVQADYVLPVKKLTIEAGLKGIMRDNKSDFQFLSQASGGDFVPNASRTNVFNNTQQVYSAYNSYKYDLKKWGFRAGVRMENTVINANFVSSVSHVDQNYFNVVPSVSVNRRFKNQSSINLGFSQRIQRPGINQLNPFVDRSNPNFETTGNPDLRPSTGNAFQLGYTWTKKFNLNYGFGYYWINGLIFPVSAFNPATNITRTTFQNTGRAQMFGNSINISGSFSKKWAGSVNGNVNYGIADGISNGQPIKNQGLMYNVNVNSNIKFDKGWRLSGGVFFFSGSLTVQEKQKGFITTNFTVTKDIVKDKLSLTATTNNPFNKYRLNKTHIFGPGYDQNNISQQYFRSGNISMNYRFGKLKEAIKKNKRGISNDDVSN